MCARMHREGGREGGNHSKGASKKCQIHVKVMKPHSTEYEASTLMITQFLSKRNT